MAMNLEAVLRIAAKTVGLGEITKLERAIGGAEKAAKDARSAFSAVVNSATWQAAAVGAAAIGTGLAVSMRTAMEFEKAMSGVAAKVGGTSDEISSLNQLARDLGRTTQFSASQAAEGMDFLAMAGFKANDIISAMPGLLDLAAAGNLELGSAADIASNILGGLNLKAEETGRVADVLAKAATSSNVSVEMLGETFKFVAPVAAQAGVGLEELAAATGLLGDAGIQASEAGTGLRSVLLRLAAPPAEAAKALDRLSVATKDNAGNMRPFGEILRDVDRRFSELNLGTAEQLEIQNDLYGKTAIASGAILQQAAATGTLDEKTRLLIESQGAASEMAKTMNDNVAGAFTRLMSAVEGFQIQLMSGASPALQGLIDVLANTINVVTDLMERFPLLTSAVLALSAAFVALVAVAPFIAAFISVIGSLQAAIAGASLAATVAGWAGAIVPAIVAIKAAFLGLVGWLGATFLPAIVAFFSGPVGWTVLAVAAVVAMAVAFREPIMKFFDWLGGAIRDGLKALWQWGEPIRQFWIGVWEGVKAPVADYFKFVDGVFRWGMQAAWAIVDTVLIQPWLGVWRTLFGAAEAFMNALRTNIFEPLGRFFNDVFIKPVQAYWAKFTGQISSDFDAISKEAQQAWKQIADWFNDWLVKPITSAWQAVANFIPEAMKKAGEVVQGIWRGVVDGVKGLIRGFLQAIVGSINNVTGLVNKLIGSFNRLPGSDIPLIPTLQVPAFAQGGVVSRPTLAMVGEGGEDEYIIPASKMQAASSRFLGGARGASVIPSGPSAAPARAHAPQITIRTGPVMQQQDGSRWVSMDDFQRGLQQMAELVVDDLRRPEARLLLGTL